LTVVAMLPVPFAGQLEPALAVQVQVTPLRLAGMMSLTLASIAVSGPALRTVIVYVTSDPATLEVALFVFVMLRSLTGAPKVMLEMSSSPIAAFPGMLSGSGVPLEAISAVFLIGPLLVTITVNVSVALEFVGTLEIVHAPVLALYAPALTALDCRLRPVGRSSEMLTFTASLGPALFRRIVKVTLAPGSGAEFVTVFERLKSALPASGVVTLEVFGPVGSGVLEETLAEFVTLEPAKFAGTSYVTVIVSVVFGATVPKLQGKAVRQSPVLETKLNPVGVGSLTITFAAFDGPSFLTVIVYVALEPGVMLAGPFFVIVKFACGVRVS
jgi:hypothetical protein